MPHPEFDFCPVPQPSESPEGRNLYGSSSTIEAERNRALDQVLERLSASLHMIGKKLPSARGRFWRSFLRQTRTELWQELEATKADSYRRFIASLLTRVAGSLSAVELTSAHLAALEEGVALLGRRERLTVEDYDRYRATWSRLEVETLPSFPRYLKALKRDLTAS